MVRYAESNGYERDGAKPQAWRYRDYVIDAFNKDKPYDRFLTEQIAGDEVEGSNAETQIATSTYISPSMVSQGIVYEFCRSGALERSIEMVKTALRERAATLCAALRHELPDARFVEPQGGYFLWVELPRGTDVDALFTAAAGRGVVFVKGSEFVLEGGDSSLRLAYSGVTPAEIEEGIKRLADAYAEIEAVGAPAA